MKTKQINRDEWSQWIRLEMAKRRMTIVDLVKCLQEQSGSKSPSYPTVYRWVTGNANINKIEQIQNTVLNFK
jgi:hypothetical protein